MYLDPMFTTRPLALRPRDLFLRGVGSILEICPPPSRFHELVLPQTADEAFALYRANIEGYLGAAVARWEGEEEDAPAADSFDGPKPSKPEQTAGP